ncbi:MAG: 4-hydroxy-tetrahydrodipicolinate reductase [Clostridiaceae bacterium]
MIKIVLVGCSGRMGNAISSLVKTKNEFSISAGVDKNKNENVDYPIYSEIFDIKEDFDAVLDFSRPASLDSLLKFCKDNKKPLVLCTTGYDEGQLKAIEVASLDIPLFKSANMSIGINIISSVLKNISSFLYEDFDIEIIEKHHNQKVDSPSGTAILLADSIKNSLDTPVDYVYGREGIKKRDKAEIGIHAVRGGNIVGEHSVIFAGGYETIEIKHSAMSREVFALGSLKACEFMKDKENGFYSMDDVIKLNK